MPNLTKKEIELYKMDSTFLYDKWLGFLQNGEPEQYLINLRSTLIEMNEETLIKVFIPAFHKLEKEYGIHLQSEFSGYYENLFYLIRGILFNSIMPPDILLVADILLSSNIRLKQDQRISGHIKNLENIILEEPDVNFIVVTLIYILEIFNGNLISSKKRYIKTIAGLQLVKMPKDVDPIIKDMLKLVFMNFFDNFEQLVLFLSEEIFDEKEFFELDLGIQKARINFVMVYLWWVIGAEKIFLKFYDKFKLLFYKAMEMGSDEFVFFIYYPLSHIYLNLTDKNEEWKIFNEEVEKKLSDYILNTMVSKYKLLPVTPKINKDKLPVNIGFVFDRIVFNAPTYLLYSLLKVLTDNNDGKYKFYLYDIELVEKCYSNLQFVEEIKKLGICYINCRNLIEEKGYIYNKVNKYIKLREKIIEDEIDILIMPGTEASYNLLFTTRSAPLQIFWSFGNYMYDVPEIDYKITFSPSSPNFLTPYPIVLTDFHYFLPPMEHMFYDRPANMETINKIKNRFEPGTFILGTMGRLVKIDSDPYLETVAKIMIQNPRTVYLACGRGPVDNIMKKIKELGISDRFYFEGFVDPYTYSHVIDLYLDSFPFNSGESLNKFKYKGGVYVKLYKDSIHLKDECFKELNATFYEKYESAMKNKGIDQELVSLQYAYSIDEYIEKAGKIINNKDIRAKLSYHAVFFERYRTNFFNNKGRMQFLELMDKFINLNLDGLPFKAS